MGHRKLKKFAEVATFSNVFEPTQAAGEKVDFPLKGKWNADYFKNNNPIILELGCGKGEYTIGLAKRFPNKNFIGMDIKGARLWRGAKIAVEEKMQNVAFVRNRIDFIESYFGPNEVSEIWIPFPDPYPRKGKTEKRLMSASFVKRYRNLTKPGAVIHFKSDNENLYAFAMEQVQEHKYKLLANSADIYNDAEKLGEERNELLTKIQTYYESTFLKIGKKIHYVEFVI
ncbi:MAG TPA: tRNA (guanosine(46)-N7)-methyltransferase TrmB [Bacteroidia bacterium]|jgi:tRNA (guanine-N7-)-methyltransferase|nr:tRNA (guanosine(46)-N7)-methyltransferase TrmB [Bacteroidia bacterium]